MLAPITLLVAVAAVGAPPVAVLHDDPEGKDRQGLVTFLDPMTAAPLGAVPVGLLPSAATLDDETGRLFVIDRGKCPLAGRASLSVLDVARRERLAQLPLPPCPNAAVFTPGEGRIFVPASGKKDTQATVSVFDRRTLKPLARIDLGPSLDWVGNPERQLAVVSPSGRSVFVLRSPPAGAGLAKKSRNVPSRLVTLDAVSGALRDQRDLSPRAAQMRLSKDRTALYVLCLGHDDDDKARKAGAYGTLYVLDPETGATLREIDAGFNPPSLEQHEATGRVFLLVRAPKEGSPRVVVLEGANVVAKLETSPPVQIVAMPGSSEYLLLTDGALLRVDGGFGTILGRLDLGFDAAELLLSPDGATAWVAERNGSRFGSIPVPSLLGFRPFTSGRAGVKFGQGVATAGALLAPFVGPFVGESTDAFVYDGPRASKPSLAISPDGAHLFVNNQRTEDVTVLDTAKMAILDIDGVGDGVTTVMFPLAGGSATVAAWLNGLAIVRVDPQGKVTVQDLEFHERGLSSEPKLTLRGDKLWIARRGSVEVLSATTGLVESRVALERIQAVIFP